MWRRLENTLSGIKYGLNYQKILSLHLSKVNNGSTKSQNKKVFITIKQVCN